MRSERGNQSECDRLANELRRVRRYEHWSKEMKSDVDSIASSYPSDNFVHEFGSSGDDWTVGQIPFNIAAVINNLRESFRTMILTSATLYVDDSLDFLSGELGRHDEPSSLFDDDHAKQISSPFAFDKQVRGVVITNNLSYNFRRFNLDRSLYDLWKADIARGIAVLSVATYGRTLVLFTNRNEMEDVFALLAPVLADHDIVPLLQRGSSLAEIESFRHVQHSVLLGSGSLLDGGRLQGKDSIAGNRRSFAVSQ